MTAAAFAPLAGGLTPADVRARPYADWAIGCLDVLLDHGRGVGARPGPAFASILDVRDRTCPRDPAALDECWRVQRRGRRNPAGANLDRDHALMRSLHAASALTGGRRYADAAEDCVRWWLAEQIDEHGLPWWGWHRHWDLHAGRRDGHDGSPHEIHATDAHAWDLLWRADPAATRRAIEAMWTWHVVDKSTGEINRHGDGRRGCDFAMSAGAFIHAFSFLHAATGEGPWLERARLLSGRFWERRDPRTGLVPDRPNAGAERFDGSCSPTTIPGLYAYGLLKGHALTGDPLLRDRAVGHLRAWALHASDSGGGFWAALRLDGSPVRWDGRSGEADGDLSRGDYSRFEPYDEVDPWQPYALGYDQPLAAAQAFAYAAGLGGRADLLATALRWGELIAADLPAGRCRRRSPWYARYAADWAPHGTYAHHYARAISLFTHLRALTGEARWLDRARLVADDAVARLWHRGLLRGHPAKPYYESVDGVGQLIQALIALDAVVRDPAAAGRRDAIVLAGGAATLPYDNW